MNKDNLAGKAQGVKPAKGFKINKKLRKLFIGADVIKNRDFKEIEYVVDKLIPRGSLCALALLSLLDKSN